MRRREESSPHMVSTHIDNRVGIKIFPPLFEFFAESEILYCDSIFAKTKINLRENRNTKIVRKQRTEEACGGMFST